MRRMLPCATEFLLAVPLLISQRFDLSGSHARRRQKRVMRRGAPGFRSRAFRINRARVGDTLTVQSTSEIADLDSCRPCSFEFLGSICTARCFWDTGLSLRRLFHNGMFLLPERGR